MKRIGNLMAVLVLAVFLAQGLARGSLGRQVEGEDHTLIKRAIFLSLDECSSNPELLRESLNLLGQIGYEALGKTSASISEPELRRLVALRHRWLEEARGQVKYHDPVPPTDKELEDYRRKRKAFPMAQQAPAPPQRPTGKPGYWTSAEMTLPAELQVHGQKSTFVLSKEYIDDQLATITGRLLLSETGASEFREATDVLEREIRRKGDIRAADQRLNPNTEYNILRRAVFVAFGPILCDETIVKNALLSESSRAECQWTTKHIDVLVSNVESIRNLRRKWLRDEVLPRLRRITDEDTISVELPKQVWVEGYQRTLPSTQQFSRRDLPRLEFEYNVLTNADKVAASELGSYRRKATALKTARRIVMETSIK